MYLGAPRALDQFRLDSAEVTRDSLRDGKCLQHYRRYATQPTKCQRLIFCVQTEFASLNVSNLRIL
jgi:hypothetical protein